MSKTDTTSSGGSVAGVLTIVFVVLRLTHVIDWSWWWVISPIWISIGTALLFLIIAGLFMAIGYLIHKR